MFRAVSSMSFLLVLFLFTAPPASEAQTFSVDATDDAGNANPGDGICDDGSGTCTLRAAIQEANAGNGDEPVAIHFAIPTDDPGFDAERGVFTIAPGSALRANVPVIIDGSTQPGFNGAPVIQISGENAPSAVNGIELFGGDSEVRGLMINRWSSAIFITTAGGNVVAGNILGTDENGTTGIGNSRGVDVGNIGNNRMGGADAEDRNLISGNSTGINLSGDYGGTVISGNFIGTDAHGTSPLPNTNNGISASGTGSLIIGGTEGHERMQCSGACNLISGNGWAGVAVSQGGEPAVTVEGNFIGTDITGQQALGNGRNGIAISGSAPVHVGGSDDGAGNLISANAWNGIETTSSAGVIVHGNHIGTNATGNQAIPNQRHGVLIATWDNQIGGTEAGAGNLISGNNWAGVRLEDGQNNAIRGNLIGTDVSGESAVPNREGGITTSGQPRGTLIGGTDQGARNVISGNEKSGIDIGSTDQVIQGNFIGTNILGTAALPNTEYGVSIRGTDNLVGGSEPGAGNVISGNGEAGLVVFGSRITVHGNYVGLDAAGASALPNEGDGIWVQGKNNLVGGAGETNRNVVSGNRGNGVNVSFTTTIDVAGDNTIQGNYIGTDATGVQAVPNEADGVLLGFQAEENTVDANVISGNDGYGIQAVSTRSGNVITRNYIGAVPGSISPLPNGNDGIFISKNRTRVGGAPEEGNVIAFNEGNGVSVATEMIAGFANGFGNVIQGNRIFSNELIGIDLGVTPDGVTLNDVLDRDGRCCGNQQQNFPELTGAGGEDMTIRGFLHSRPNTAFEIELFSSRSCDETGYGQGEAPIGRAEVTTDANGNASFDVSFPGVTPAGNYITATATDHNPDFGTSEFSACILLDEADLYVEIEADPDPVVVGGELTYAITMGNYGPGRAFDVVLTAPLPENVAFLSMSENDADCSMEEGVVTCTLDALSSGSSVEIDVVVQPQGPGEIESTVEVAGSQPEITVWNNASTVIVHVLASADAPAITAVSPPTLRGQDIDTLHITLRGLDFENGAAARLEPTDQEGEDRPDVVVADTVMVAPGKAPGDETSLSAVFNLLEPNHSGDYRLVVSNGNGQAASRIVTVLPTIMWPAIERKGAWGFPVGFARHNHIEVTNVGNIDGSIWLEIEPPAPDAIELQIHSAQGVLLWDSRVEEDASTATLLFDLEEGETRRLRTTWRVKPEEVDFPEASAAGKTGEASRVAANSRQVVTARGLGAGGRQQAISMVKRVLKESVCEALGQKLTAADASILDAAVDGAFQELERRGEMRPEDVMTEIGNFLGTRFIPGWGQVNLAADVGACLAQILNGVRNGILMTAKRNADRLRQQHGSTQRARENVTDHLYRNQLGYQYAVLFADQALRERPCSPPPEAVAQFGALVTAPWDPNDKITNQDFECEIGTVIVDGEPVTRCVRYFMPRAAASQPINYTILFENQPDATAPATIVEITDVLSDHLDPASLEVLASSHMELLTVTTDGQTVTFRFDDVGLPPNVDPPEGEGFVEFLVSPRYSPLDDGTEIRNRASIVFDFNPPIETPDVIHVVAPLVDVVLEGVAAHDSVAVGEEVTYTFTVRNTGPDAATDVHFTASFSDADFVALTPSTEAKGICEIDNATVTCGLGRLLVSLGETISVLATRNTRGAMHASALVTTAERDGRPFNNAVEMSTPVFTPVSAEDPDGELPVATRLYANYPNPFNPSTNIRFDVHETAPVKLTVYNLLGQKIRTLLDEVHGPGSYTVVFDASRVASGVYFYRLEAGEILHIRKMVVVK